MSEVKKELGLAINEECKRTNVDSAKKRAVMQHMDYDNFHQMVLGANLFPVKSGEVSNIMGQKGGPGSSMNHLAMYNQITGSAKEEVWFDEDIVQRTLELTSQDQMVAPKSLEDFDKFFSKKLKTDFQRYIYLRGLNFEIYRQILTCEIDSELLIRIIETMTKQVL